MLHNSISRDMKVCALQLKQKPTAGNSNGNVWNFRTVISEQLLILGTASEKKTVKENDAQWPLSFQVFTFSRAVIY